MEELIVSSQAVSTGPPETSAVEDDQAIRARVRDLTSQILQLGRIDPEGVKEVMRAVTGGAPPATPPSDASGMEFSAAVRQLDAALGVSADAAHRALETIAVRGTDVTDNDIKSVHASLMKLQQDCLAAANLVSKRASGENLRRELDHLAVHAQNVGIEASARAGALMNEFATRITDTYRETAVPSLESARAFSARMALLTSGIIAGVADALGDQTGSKKAK